MPIQNGFNNNLIQHIMKKSNLYGLLIAVLLLSGAACGESEEERQAREQARMDSIRAAQQAEIDRQMAALQDSVVTAEAEAAIEEQTADYILTEEGHFVVQVGAWRSEEKAQSYVDKLSSRDYPTAYVVKTGNEETGDVWFRVRVGYLNTRDGAKIFGEELSKELNSGYWIANRD